MATVNLSASARTDTGKGVARSLRRSGQVPAIIYGHAREAQSLAINAKDLDRLLGSIAAESTVIELAVDGGRATKTLIREIQRHPYRRQILHVDFQALVAGEKVIVNVPIVLMGIPEGVRLGGGVLDQTLRELEIKVDPSNIPNHVEVDVTHLLVGGSLHVSDISVPAGVEVLDDPEGSVCVCAAPRAVIEAVAAPEAVEGEAGAAATEPEVIGRGKEDEDAEDSDDAPKKGGGDSKK